MESRLRAQRRRVPRDRYLRVPCVGGNRATGGSLSVPLPALQYPLVVISPSPKIVQSATINIEGIRKISCSWEASYRGASKELARPGRVPHLRTTRTGQWACRTTLSETLPKRARLKPPSPRLPMTISPAPNSSLSLTIAWSFGPCIWRCAPATVPPASSTFLIYLSSTPWAS